MALDFTSFSAMTIVNQGQLPCLTGTTTPSVEGITFSTLDPTGFLNGNGFPLANGNLITTYGSGEGAAQLLLGWNEEASSGSAGLHANAYIRNKNNTNNSRWSEWAQILDSQNFTQFIATSQAANAATGVWGINITGTAENARYLLPIPPISGDNTRVYHPFTITQGLPLGLTSEYTTLIWGEQFSDSSWTYTDSNNEVHTYNKEGAIGYFLTRDPNNDNITLNTYINGTHYGTFSGHLVGYADRAFGANISTVENTLAYYSNSLGTFAYTSMIKYIPNAASEVIYDHDDPTAFGNVTGLLISGTTQVSVNFLATDNRDPIVYGDGGPQIRFKDDTTYGALIFSRNGAAVSNYGPTFCLVSGYKSGNTWVNNRNVTLHTYGLISQFIAGIGVEKLDSTYTLQVGGSTYMMGDLILGQYDTTNNINTSSTVYFPRHARQQVTWSNQANSVNSNIGNLSTDGMGLYIANTNELWYAIANTYGIQLVTGGASAAINLLHNGGVIPSTNNISGTVGGVSSPVYVNAGVLTPIDYTIGTNVSASANAHQFVYYMQVGNENDGYHIDLIPATSHYIGEDGIAIGSSVNMNGYAFYVKQGNSYLEGNVDGLGNLNPKTTNTSALGTGGNDPLRWSSLFLGDADSYGDTTHPIYWNNGVPHVASYALSAGIAQGTANTLAWYSDTTSLVSTTITTNGSYLASVSYLTIGLTNQDTYNLYVNGTTRMTNTLSISVAHDVADPTINLHYNGSNASTASIAADASNSIHLSYGGTGSTITYNSRSVGINLYNEGSLYSSDGIETGNYFMSNTDGTTNGYYLNGENQQYGRLYISAYGTTTAAGAATLLLGNAIDDESAKNAQGLIQLYGTGSTATTIQAQPNGNRTFYLPNYGGAMYAAHVGSNDGVGENGKPVFVEANGRIAAFTGGIGGEKAIMYVASGKFTASNATEGDAYTPVYLNQGTLAKVNIVVMMDFTINNDKKGVQLAHTLFTSNSYVTQIVVKSGESNLNAPIAWETGDGFVKLTTTVKTGGDVTGYILVSRGTKITSNITATDIT